MRLAAQSPWGEVPETVGGIGLAPVQIDRATEVLPLGQADLSAALERAVGVGFPAPGLSAEAGAVRVLWFGRRSALVLGAAVEIEGALCVEQSDGWAGLELSGRVRRVLARLCPLDLRDTGFPIGATARSLLNHVPLSLTRLAADRWLVLVPRSMAGTALGEIVAAARRVAAR